MRKKSTVKTNLMFSVGSEVLVVLGEFDKTE